MPASLTNPTSASSLVLRLARIASSNPVEAIVAVFCAVTLVYFQLLKVVRTSDFLLLDDDSAFLTARAPSVLYSPLTARWTPLPVTPTLPTDGDTAPLHLWLRQLFVEAPRSFPAQESQEIDQVVHEAVAQALDQASCYQGATAHCWIDEHSPSQNLSATSFAFLSEDASFRFLANLSTIDLATSTTQLKKLSGSEGRRRYMSFFRRKDTAEVYEGVEGARERSKEEMQSITWMLFAARAFVMRFYGLARVNIVSISRNQFTNFANVRRKQTRPTSSSCSSPTSSCTRHSSPCSSTCVDCPFPSDRIPAPPVSGSPPAPSSPPASASCSPSSPPGTSKSPSIPSCSEKPSPSSSLPSASRSPSS